MNVTVLFFASLREALGTARETLTLPAHVVTMADLRAHLRARGPAWAEALAEARPVRMAINQAMVGADAAIPAGAELAFFPPVTGG